MDRTHKPPTENRVLLPTPRPPSPSSLQPPPIMQAQLSSPDQLQLLQPPPQPRHPQGRANSPASPRPSSIAAAISKVPRSAAVTFEVEKQALAPCRLLDAVPGGNEALHSLTLELPTGALPLPPEAEEDRRQPVVDQLQLLQPPPQP